MSEDRLQGAPSGPGSREPKPSVSASGFDPSREPNWLDVAKETGLAITHKDGIKEVDAGRDRALCLNEGGLKVLRRALERAYQQGVARARDLKRENAELREALRPFAKAGELFKPRAKGEWDQAVYSPAAGKEYAISGDDLRRARTLLSQSSEGE